MEFSILVEGWTGEARAGTPPFRVSRRRVPLDYARTVFLTFPTDRISQLLSTYTAIEFFKGNVKWSFSSLLRFRWLQLLRHKRSRRKKRLSVVEGILDSGFQSTNSWFLTNLAINPLQCVSVSVLYLLIMQIVTLLAERGLWISFKSDLVGIQKEYIELNYG